MNVISLMINGLDSQYNRLNYPADQIVAKKPIYIYCGNFTGENEIDYSIKIDRGVTKEFRAEKLKKLENLQISNIIISPLISSALLAISIVIMTVATSAFFLLAASLVAAASIASAVRGVHTHRLITEQLLLWEDPLKSTAEIRRSVSDKSIDKLLPFAGKYLHQLELERIFLVSTYSILLSFETHGDTIHLDVERIDHLIKFFNNNPLDHLKQVFPKVLQFGLMQIAVAEIYGSLKVNYELINIASQRQFDNLQKNKNRIINRSNPLVKAPDLKELQTQTNAALLELYWKTHKQLSTLIATVEDAVGEWTEVHKYNKPFQYL